MFTVTITDKSGQREARVFNKADIKIGRDSTNDIVLERGNVSKQHARILHNRGALVVVDNKSTNGTFVNGERIVSPYVLRPTDKVFVGDFVLEVAPGGDATGVEAAPRRPAASAAIDAAPTTTDRPDFEPPRRTAGRSPVAVDWDDDWDSPATAQDAADADTGKERGPLAGVLPGGDLSGAGSLESATDRLAECLRVYLEIDVEYRVRALGADCDCGQCLLCRARQALADYESERG